MIVAEHLTYHAPGGAELLRDVCCMAEAGKVTGLLGANGAGKTTLLQTLAGLIEPSTGSVTLQGKALRDMDARTRGQTIAFVEQLSRVHWPLTVENTVALGRIPFAHSMSRLKPADYAAIEDALAACEIDYLRKRQVDTLSGGELTRVLMARAMATHAPVLLVDEPTASLDPHHQLHAMELLQNRSRQENTAVMVTLHDLSLMARFCDQVMVMTHGRIVACGTPHEILAGDAIQNAYGIHFSTHSIEGNTYVATLGRIVEHPETEKAAS